MNDEMKKVVLLAFVNICSTQRGTARRKTNSQIYACVFVSLSFNITEDKKEKNQFCAHQVSSRHQTVTFIAFSCSSYFIFRRNYYIICNIKIHSKHYALPLMKNDRNSQIFFFAFHIYIFTHDEIMSYVVMFQCCSIFYWHIIEKAFCCCFVYNKKKSQYITKN